MEYTQNHGFKKPGYEDEADVAAINENFELLDGLLHRITFSETEPQNPKEGDIWLKPVE